MHFYFCRFLFLIFSQHYRFDIGRGRQLIFEGGRKPDGFAILDGCCFGSSLITLLLMNVESPDGCAFFKLKKNYQ